MGRIVAFFGLVIACLSAAHFLVNAGLRRIQTSSFGVWNRILTGQANADIVISGSSRALTHYDPRIIQEVTGRSTYNIGLNGSQTDMQVARLRAYLQHNRKPALVIHNLDLFSFETTKQVYDPAQYVPHLHEPEIYAALAAIDPGVWKWRYLPLYGYAVEDMRFTWCLGLLAWTGWMPSEDRPLGFLPRDTAWTGDFEHFKAQNIEGVRFPIEPEGVRQLDALVSLCRHHGIDVLLAYSPVYHEMRELERNRNEVFERFREIAARHEAILWDFSESVICLSRDNFYNSQHLNSRGASLFSHELAQRLVTEPRLSHLWNRRSGQDGRFVGTSEPAR